MVLLFPLDLDYLVVTFIPNDISKNVYKLIER